MKINRKTINNFIYVFLVLFMAVSGLFDARVVWHIIIVMLYVIAYISNRKQRTKNITIPSLFVVVIFLFLASTLISENNGALFYNIRSSLYSLCMVGILYTINSYDYQFFCKKIFTNIKWFNILLIINIIVLFIQTQHTAFLIKSSWLANNSYYEDHCAGLFGFNATNVLGLYSIFVMMVNLSYVQVYAKHKKAIILYTLLTQGIMAFLSQYNDNMGFYILLLIFLAVYTYIIVNKNKNMVKRIGAMAKYVLLIVAILVIALHLPVLGDYIRSAVFNRIQRILFYESFGGASGSSERLAIIRYAFTKGTTWKLGTGIGATQWIQARAFGFMHFGLSSIGSYTLIAGVWFYVAYTLLYSELYYSLFSVTKKERNIIMKIIFTIIVVIFTLYTTIYNDARTVLMVGLIAIVIRPMLNRESVINNDKIIESKKKVM